jgi:DNA-directed RNA polymerase specialized sigma24 family protein
LRFEGRLALGSREPIGFSADGRDRVAVAAGDRTWDTELLGQLPPNHAEAVREYVLEERCYPEIATELQTSNPRCISAAAEP